MEIVEPFIAEFEKRNPTLKIGADGMVYNRVVEEQPQVVINDTQVQTIGKDSISLNTTVQISQVAGYTLPDIPQKSNFTFGSGSPLCPANDCKQEFISAFYDRTSPEAPAVQGTLKIENKTTSTPDIIKYSLIPFAGNFLTTSIEENRKTANRVLMFSGDFDLGGEQYRVTGTFDNATRVLNFGGERITS